jgi:hypothetical protein
LNFGCSSNTFEKKLKNHVVLPIHNCEDIHKFKNEFNTGFIRSSEFGVGAKTVSLSHLFRTRRVVEGNVGHLAIAAHQKGRLTVNVEDGQLLAALEHVQPPLGLRLPGVDFRKPFRPKFMI